MKYRGKIAMRLSLMTALVILLVPLAGIRAETVNSQCVICHEQRMDRIAMPAKLSAHGIHNQAGIGCNDCHGGDPTYPRWHGRPGENPDLHFNGKPSPEEIPELCNKCHGDPIYMRQHNPSLRVDQLELYKTSRHGQLLLGEGDTKAANCVSCHSVHDIKAVNDPSSTVYATNLPGTCSKCHSDKNYMAGRSIPTDQFELYKKSVHGTALLERGDRGVPACNDCHGNHGAYPPGVDNIAAVCGTCHVMNAQLYQASFHSGIFEAMGEPGCETCHGNHGIIHPDESFLTDGENATCLKCHESSQDDNGFIIASSMKTSLDSLHNQLSLATELVDEAEQSGMEVSDLSFELRDINQQYIKTRTSVHSFDDSEVQASAEPGLKKAAEVIAGAYKALKSHSERRWWLGGATLILILLIIGVYFKLREVESSSGS